MREVRTLVIEDRRDFYIEGRIEDQGPGMRQKAKTNQEKEWRWFWAIILAQLLAAASAFVLVGWPQSHLRFTGIFATLATAFNCLVTSQKASGIGTVI